jgi:hypothetical protein
LSIKCAVGGAVTHPSAWVPGRHRSVCGVVRCRGSLSTSKTRRRHRVTIEDTYPHNTHTTMHTTAQTRSRFTRIASHPPRAATRHGHAPDVGRQKESRLPQGSTPTTMTTTLQHASPPHTTPPTTVSLPAAVRRRVLVAYRRRVLAPASKLALRGMAQERGCTRTQVRWRSAQVAYRRRLRATHRTQSGIRLQVVPTTRHMLTSARERSRQQESRAAAQSAAVPQSPHRFERAARTKRTLERLRCQRQVQRR